MLAEINSRGSLQGKQQTSAAVVGLDCNIACICGILSHFKELFLTPTESRHHVPAQERSRSPYMNFGEKKLKSGKAKNQGCLTAG